MKDKHLSIEEARSILTTATRNSLTDYTFGDAEVDWQKDGVAVAEGYFSAKSSSVWINATADRLPTKFEGDAARELRFIGKPGRRDRNDEGEMPLLG